MNKTADKVKLGKYVSFSYSITDKAGHVIQQHDLPLGYIYGGDSEIISGIDNIILGKQAGDELLIDLDPNETFGAHDVNLVFTDDINNAPIECRNLGAEVQMKNEQGEIKIFYVTKITDTHITIDGNHPLAGKPLLIKINLLEVRDATPNDAKTSGIHSTQPTIN